MHQLNRASVAAPACLEAYDHAQHKWSDLEGDCKAQLRAALVQMQGISGVTTADANEYGVRCAYCEGAVHHDGHIEHFCRKNPAHFPELKFEWSNLFLACGSHEHCGHYKDRKAAPAYNPDDLIKPDEHDPDAYLYFHSSGEVRARSHLNAADRHRAEETIRVFGLDNRSLCGSRENALSHYKKIVMTDLQEIASWSQDIRNEYLQSEIDATRWDPYATTIKHFLQTYL